MASIAIDITNQAGDTVLFSFDGETDVLANLDNNYKPVWAKQDIPQKQGNNRQFMGTQDADLTLSGVFQGSHSERVTKKNALRSLALDGTIVRLDTNGYDTSIEGRDYVITNISIPQQGGKVWQFSILFEEYNN